MDIATSLYFEGFGYYNTIANAATASLTPGTGTVPAGVPTAYTGTLTSEGDVANPGGVTPSIAHERSNVYPTSRTLFNIYRTDTVTASTAGFLNWICDTNPAGGGLQTKGKDQLYGGNFDNEITNTINNFGFSRLTDAQPELSAAAETPADGLFTPNATCDAQLPVTTNSTATVTNTLGTVPTGVQVGWVVSGTGIPSGDTVAAISGSTITLASAATASGSIQLYFPGRPPVLGVADPTH